MKVGKLSGKILRRTVIKNIGAGNLYKERKMCPGMGATVFKSGMTEGGSRLVMATESGLYPVIKSCNNVWAKGAIPKAVQVCVTMPERDREIRLKELTEEISADCAMLGTDYAGGYTQVGENVGKTVISATCIGEQTCAHTYVGRDVKAGDMIAVTKWIGIGGIRRVIEEKRQEIRERYRDSVIDTAYGERFFLSVRDEALLCAERGVSYMLPLSTGGVFEGLWNLSEVTGLGFTADLRAIPVCQEIIELCELYDINPYQLESSGSLLMTFSPECDIIDVLQENGIPACVIGELHAGNDKKLVNLDEERCLESPGVDEIHRLVSL